MFLACIDYKWLQSVSAVHGCILQLKKEIPNEFHVLASG